MILSREDEYCLVRRAQIGDQEAWVTLLEAHEKRLRYMARRYGCRGLDADDLYQEGCIGFMDAVPRFDPTRGNRLWTYAQHRVRWFIIRACARRHGFSEAARRYYARVTRIWRELQQDLPRAPTAEEVHARLLQRLQKQAEAEGKEAVTNLLSMEAVQEVLQALAGRETPLASEDEEEEEGVRISSLSSEPDEYDFSDGEEMGEWERLLLQCLGETNARKFLVLTILREKPTLRDPSLKSGTRANLNDYKWPEIAILLAQPDDLLSPPWSTVAAEYPYLLAGLADWTQVHALFQQPPSVLTGDALKQWYSRQREGLRKCAG